MSRLLAACGYAAVGFFAVYFLLPFVSWAGYVHSPSNAWGFTSIYPWVGALIAFIVWAPWDGFAYLALMGTAMYGVCVLALQLLSPRPVFVFWIEHGDMNFWQTRPIPFESLGLVLAIMVPMLFFLYIPVRFRT